MFQRPIIIMCFAALRLAVAAESADVTTTSASVPKNTAAPVAYSISKPPCSKPSSIDVDPAGCCSLTIPFPGEVLSSCQKANDHWLDGWKNSTCGSQCIFNYLVNGTTLVKDIMSNPPEKWLLEMQNLGTYYNAISNCVKFANIEQLLVNPLAGDIAFQDVLCKLELLAVADCISKHLFLNCPMFTKSEQCQTAKTFLNSTCLYSSLFA